MKNINFIVSLSFAAALFGASSLSAQERVWANDPTIEQVSEHVFRWGLR